MPHSIQSKKDLIDNAHKGYLSELFQLLGTPKQLQKYHDLLVELRESRVTNTAEKLDSFLAKENYPTLCNRVVGFYSDGKYMLKETELTIVAVVPDSSPTAYVPTKDILSSIVQHLQYTALGRLAKTCKWMNANITVNQVEAALEKARKSFGRVQLFNEERMMRLWNIEEEPLEFGQIRAGSSIVVLRKDGRTYLGHTETNPFSHEERASLKYKNSSTRMWFQATILNTRLLPSNHDLSVKFMIRRAGGYMDREYCLFFDECVEAF